MQTPIENKYIGINEKLFLLKRKVKFYKNIMLHHHLLYYCKMIRNMLKRKTQLTNICFISFFFFNAYFLFLLR